MGKLSTRGRTLSSASSANPGPRFPCFPVPSPGEGGSGGYGASRSARTKSQEGRDPRSQRAVPGSWPGLAGALAPSSLVAQGEGCKGAWWAPFSTRPDRKQTHFACPWLACLLILCPPSIFPSLPRLSPLCSVPAAPLIKPFTPLNHNLTP